MVAIPQYRSSMFMIKPRIYEADRDNNIGADITNKVTSAIVDYDIDRQGAKGHLNMSVWDASVAPSGGWIAPFLDVKQEGVPEISSQLGLFELGEPTVTMGANRSAEVTGEDIIAIMERAVLTEPEVTPKGHNVMDDVIRSVQVATCRGRSKNFFTSNPSFDTSLAGWTSSQNGGADVVIGWNGIPPYGVKAGVCRHQVNAGSPELSNAYSYSTTGMSRRIQAHKYCRAEARVLANVANARTMMSLQFLDDQGAQVARVNQTLYSDVANVWKWHSINMEIPDDAVEARLILYTYAMPGTQVVTRWDDTSIRSIAAMPIERHAFPLYPKAATTDIPHHANVRWTVRINDLLKAIGHHAVHATLDGRPTSRYMRDVRTDNPTRTYTHGTDSRVVSGVRTEQSTSNLYNVVVAVKEDFETGEVWTAVARNDDPEHPWSTIQKGEIAPQTPVQSNDAVDQEELQVLADEALAEASMQQSLTMDVIPDPLLTVYDIIEVVSPGGEEEGRWAIEALSCGLTADNPVVTMTARRTYTSQKPE